MLHLLLDSATIFLSEDRHEFLGRIGDRFNNCIIFAANIASPRNKMRRKWYKIRMMLNLKLNSPWQKRQDIQMRNSKNFGLLY